MFTSSAREEGADCSDASITIVPSSSEADLECVLARKAAGVASVLPTMATLRADDSLR